MPGGPVVKTSPFNAGCEGSFPGWGTKIPHASWTKNKYIKQKQYCNKFNKDFKNGPHQKKKKSLKGKINLSTRNGIVLQMKEFPGFCVESRSWKKGDG